MKKKESNETSSVLDCIIWFENNKRFDSNEMILAGAKRSISYHLPSKDYKGKSGSFYSIKNNCDMFYESQLEFKLYALLESSSRVARYQSQPMHIKYGTDKKYYPDTIFYLNDGSGVICEVKPIKEMGLESNWKKWKAMKEFCIQEGYGMLITDGKTTFKELLKHELCQSYVDDVMAIIELHKQVIWADYYEIKNKHKATWEDLTCLLIQQKLTYITEPKFRITDRNRSTKLNK